MATKAKQKSEMIANLLNSTYVSMKAIVPIEHKISKPSLAPKSISIGYGVIIGVTGDLKGQLILEAETDIFSKVGEVMYGMPLEDEMLNSFSGELGNMIAGRLSTTIANKGVHTDITSPTIIDGNTNLLGHTQALKIVCTFEAIGDMSIYLLLDY